MNAYFNELTLHDDSSRNYNEMPKFGRIWSRFQKETGLKILFSGISPKEMAERAGCDKNGTHRQLIYSIFRNPYIDHEKDSHTKLEEDRYAGSDFFLLSDQGVRIRQSSLLGWVVIKRSLFLGFPKDDFWQKCNYSVEEIKSSSEKVLHEVKGITIEQHFDDVGVKDWLDKNFRAEPIKTTVDVAHKKRKVLPAHHGVKELNDFADRVLQNEYVLEVVNSVDYMPHCKSLIGKVYPDGCMDICLYWTSAHCALCVRTTAQNKYQAEKIKRLLEEKFG